MLVNFATWIPDFLTCLVFWTYLFLVTLVVDFPPLKSCDHVVVSGSSDFPSNSKEDPPFHCTAFYFSCTDYRGGSRAAATSKMERFVIIVNGFQPLTIITKRSILDVAAVLDPLLD